MNRNLAALRSVEIDFIENPRTLDGVNGLVLTGGSDIDPARYHQENEGSESPDKERDEREILLVRDALTRDIPILAICRGMQALKSLSGTLTQHIDAHRHPGVPNAHEIEIRDGTRLATILQPGEYSVNSRHHQCVARLGAGLIVSAKADDIIEALELPDKRFVVAVQWHPEDRITGPDSKLFEAFASAVRHVTSAAPA